MVCGYKQGRMKMSNRDIVGSDVENINRSYEKTGFVMVTDVIPGALLEIRFMTNNMVFPACIDSYIA